MEIARELEFLTSTDRNDVDSRHRTRNPVDGMHPGFLEKLSLSVSPK